MVGEVEQAPTEEHFVLPEIKEQQVDDTKLPKRQKQSLFSKLFHKDHSAIPPVHKHERLTDQFISVEKKIETEDELQEVNEEETHFQLLRDSEAHHEREAHVQEKDHHYLLHKRLDEEIRQRHMHLVNKENKLNQKSSILDQKHDEILRKESELSKSEQMLAEVKKLRDELENREITVRHHERQIASLQKNLDRKQKQLDKKEEQLVKKEQELSQVKASEAQLETRALAAESMIEKEDDAILYLQQKIDTDKSAFADEHITRQLQQQPVSKKDKDTLEQMHLAMKECRVLLAINDKAGARAQYKEIKQLFEQLEKPSKRLFDEIVELYNAIKCA